MNMIPMRWIASTVALATLAGCSQLDSRPEKAQAQLRRVADDLDAQTTDTGRYIRAKAGPIAETDPWGTKLKVAYAADGTAEELSVQSAGPDHEFGTDDDLFEQRVSVNLAGVGEGIKQNIGEVAEEAASGAVRGAIRGVSEGFKERLPKLGKNSDDEVKQPAK
jgi:hypothetical protein